MGDDEDKPIEPHKASALPDAEADDAVAELIGYSYDGERIVIALGEGDDATEAEARVRADGGRITTFRLLKSDPLRPPGISAEDFARFNELLASAITRGVPLMDGVRDIAGGTRRPAFRDALDRAAAALERGESVESAFDPRVSGFPALYGSLVRAGASAGSLSDVLLGLARGIRLDAAFRRGIIESLIYPLLVVATCLGLLVFCGLVLMPNYHEATRTMDVAHPLAVELLTATTVRARVVWACVILSAGFAFITWLLVMRHTSAMRRVRERLLRRLPVVSRLYTAALWSSAIDTLATLFHARVSAPEALRLAGPATGSRWVAEAFERVAAAVECGTPIGDAARADATVPRRVVRALDVGELKGDLATTLREAAARYRSEAARRSKLVVGLLPALIALGLGVLVLLVILTVLSPFFAFWGGGW